MQNAMDNFKSYLESKFYFSTSEIKQTSECRLE